MDGSIHAVDSLAPPIISLILYFFIFIFFFYIRKKALLPLERIAVMRLRHVLKFRVSTIPNSYGKKWLDRTFLLQKMLEMILSSIVFVGTYSKKVVF